MRCDGAKEVQCRVEVSDPNDKRQTKLISLEELLRGCAQRREPPPILTSTERLREAKMANGMFKANYAERANALRAQMAAKDAGLAAMEAAHRTEIERLQQRHRTELRKRDDQHSRFAITSAR